MSMEKKIENQKQWGAIILRPSCLNYCVFCGKVNTTAEELREEEKDVAKNLAEFKKRGIKNIEISGNDPIEYKKIVPLVKYMKQMGFADIQLSTHGRQLADKHFLNSLIAAGVNRFRIPLYGSRAWIHDAVTRAPGSFKETRQGIKLLLRKSSFIDLQISYLIMRQNKDDVIDIIDIMARMKVKDFYMAYPFLADPDEDAHYIPLKDLGPYVKKAHKYAKKINYPMMFFEIPYCVFGFVDDSINNISLPPDLGEHCQPQEKHRTNIKDMPQYRLKKKVSMCRECACADFCGGFPVNDVDKFGLGKLKPIKKI